MFYAYALCIDRPPSHTVHSCLYISKKVRFWSKPDSKFKKTKFKKTSVDIYLQDSSLAAQNQRRCQTTTLKRLTIRSPRYLYNIDPATLVATPRRRLYPLDAKLLHYYSLFQSSYRNLPTITNSLSKLPTHNSRLFSVKIKCSIFHVMTG